MFARLKWMKLTLVFTRNACIRSEPPMIKSTSTMPIFCNQLASQWSGTKWWNMMAVLPLPSVTLGKPNTQYCDISDLENFGNKFPFVFSMKYIPEYFREKTTQHYGKSGFRSGFININWLKSYVQPSFLSFLSWHITVFVCCKKDANGKILRDIQSHITVLEGRSVKQDAPTVKALIETSLQIYTKGNPQVKSIWIKSKLAVVVMISVLMLYWFLSTELYL